MNIAIIGYGFVGNALFSVIRSHKREQVTIVDPLYFDTTLEEALTKNPEIIFLCLPTPTVEGYCDDALVINHVERLKDYSGCLIVKSTVPPSTVEKIQKIRPTTIIWPELLRESNAARDILWPDIIVVGAPSDMQFQYVANFIMNETEIHWNKNPSLHPPNSKIWKVSPKEASFFKYAVNSFLATKVLFFHQMFQWMETRGDGASYEMLTKLLSAEGRVGDSHLKAPGEHGLGYAGSCLPKDVEALLNQVYHKDGTSFPLLNEVHEINKQQRKSWAVRQENAG